MSLIQLPNGGFLLEESFAFPEPEIVIRVAFRLEDIKYLSPKSSRPETSLVYFYADRDYLKNLSHYTGETSNSANARFNNTHKNKDWLKKIKYPLIGIVESSSTAWTTEMRKTIESVCAYKMKSLGFDVVNSSTVNWAHGVVYPATVNGHYVETVARLVVNYQLALLGLVGVDIFSIGEELGLYEIEKPTITTLNTDTDDEELFSVPNPNWLKAEDKFEILIRSGKIHVDQPLYITHRLVNKTVFLRSSEKVEYKENLYSPREALKAIAHEVFAAGVTTKQAQGWSGYNPLLCYAIEVDNELIKLDVLWNEVKHRITNAENAGEIIDEDWYQLVMSNNLAGCKLLCNTKEAEVGAKGEIHIEGHTFYSLAEYGEYADGLNDEGFGDYKVRIGAELYDITSD